MASPDGEESKTIQNIVNMYSSNYQIPKCNAETDDIEQFFLKTMRMPQDSIGGPKTR